MFEPESVRITLLLSEAQNFENNFNTIVSTFSPSLLVFLRPFLAFFPSSFSALLGLMQQQQQQRDDVHLFAFLRAAFNVPIRRTLRYTDVFLRLAREKSEGGGGEEGRKGAKVAMVHYTRRIRKSKWASLYEEKGSTGEREREKEDEKVRFDARDDDGAALCTRGRRRAFCSRKSDICHF